MTVSLARKAFAAPTAGETPTLITTN